MHVPHLRRTFLELVLACAPAVLPACDGSDPDPIDPIEIDAPLDCMDYFEHMIRVAEPPPMELEMLVRACEADALMCRDLCAAVLGTTTIMRAIETCIVTHDATGHDVTVGYQAYNGSPGCPVEGRRPAGLRAGRGRTCRGAARHLARAAWFEGASVHAFVQLACELARHGSPVALQEAARAAAVDEVLHTRLMTELAIAHGATPPAAEVDPPEPRSLEALALENATEGLVGETWSALVATWQATHAPTPALRAIYARIAEDETRHAALARDLHDWALTRLSKPARLRVERARARAVTWLARTVRTAPAADARRALGLPDASATRRLFSAARVALWPGADGHGRATRPRMKGSRIAP